MLSYLSVQILKYVYIYIYIILKYLDKKMNDVNISYQKNIRKLRLIFKIYYIYFVCCI